MRKKIISIILLVAMVLTMAARCGKERETQTNFVFFIRIRRDFFDAHKKENKLYVDDFYYYILH